MLRRSRSLLFSALAALTFAAITLFASPSFARPVAEPADPLTLEVPGFADAYYYKPRSKAQKPILLYLHGRGGNPQNDCRKWAKVASRFGWVVCPSGPSDRGNGDRAWNNDADTAKKIVDATVAALRKKYRGRVKTRGNILIGFSEGAFVAQRIGVQDPEHWSKWLILAANDSYWFGDAPQLIEQNHRKIRRVYLFTGENDMVAQNTVRAGEMLKERHVNVRVQLMPGLGHEIPADRMVLNYRRPLRWLISAK